MPANVQLFRDMSLHLHLSRPPRGGSSAAGELLSHNMLLAKQSARVMQTNTNANTLACSTTRMFTLNMASSNTEGFNVPSMLQTSAVNIKELRVVRSIFPKRGWIGFVVMLLFSVPALFRQNSFLLVTQASCNNISDTVMLEVCCQHPQQLCIWNGLGIAVKHAA